jgi:hypothetical protein
MSHAISGFRPKQFQPKKKWQLYEVDYLDEASRHKRKIMTERQIIELGILERRGLSQMNILKIKMIRGLKK